MHNPLPAEVRRLGMWCHLAGLSWLTFFIFPVPYLWLLAPYLVWKLNREVHPFVDEQGKEALSFQVSMAVYLTASLLIAVFLLLVTCGVIIGTFTAQSPVASNAMMGLNIVLGIGFVVVLLITPTLLVIRAARKALNGEIYRYPMNLRFFG